MNNNNTVKCFKTLHGDFIGKLIDIDIESGEYLVDACMAIHLQQTQEGSVRVQLVPLVYPVPDNAYNNAMDIELNRSMVLFKYEPSNELFKLYTQETSSIQLQ